MQALTLAVSLSQTLVIARSLTKKQITANTCRMDCARITVKDPSPLPLSRATTAGVQIMSLPIRKARTTAINNVQALVRNGVAPPTLACMDITS
jgi:hypothetical protein